MKLTLDQRGRHDVFDMGRRSSRGGGKSHSSRSGAFFFSGRRAIGELETHNANLLTENAILWQRSEEATREAELLRDRLDRVRRLIPDPGSPRGEDHSLILNWSSKVRVADRSF